MTLVPFRFGSSPLGRLLLAAFVVSFVSVGSAFAQSGPHVRTIEEGTAITTTRHGKGFLLMHAPAGTMLQVIYTVGDMYSHYPSNWYWVVLPADAWGTRRVGSISGRLVEPVPMPEPSAGAAMAEAPMAAAAAQPAPGPSPAPAPAAPPLADASARPTAAPVPEITEVVHFEFAKSDLTEEAQRTLAAAVGSLAASVSGASFAVEGHADWTGPEAFNETLGLARAEAVKQYLATQHQIALDRISVRSYGESQPAASNDTREGRAQNRRVVVNVGPAPQADAR